MTSGTDDKYKNPIEVGGGGLMFAVTVPAAVVSELGGRANLEHRVGQINQRYSLDAVIDAEAGRRLADLYEVLLQEPGLFDFSNADRAGEESVVVILPAPPRVVANLNGVEELSRRLDQMSESKPASLAAGSTNRLVDVYRETFELLETSVEPLNP